MGLSELHSLGAENSFNPAGNDEKKEETWGGGRKWKAKKWGEVVMPDGIVVDERGGAIFQERG